VPCDNGVGLISLYIDIKNKKKKMYVRSSFFINLLFPKSKDLISGPLLSANWWRPG
jgi:hypothetical protein